MERGVAARAALEKTPRSGLTALTLVPVLGDLFALTPLALLKWLLVLGVFAAWFLVLRETWRLRLIERFVGS